jgi:hypothetical protein
MPVTGKWKLTINSPMGTQTPTLTINADGTGSLDGQRGTQALGDLKIDGENVSYTVSFSAMGRDISLKCNATADGDALKGRMDTPMGGADFTGVRVS